MILFRSIGALLLAASACFLTPPLNAQITGITASPTAASGTSATYTVNVTDTLGGNDVWVMQFLVNSTLNPNDGCAVYAVGPNQGLHQFSLWDTPIQSWGGTVTQAGQTGSNFENCTLTYGSISASGNVATYVFTLNFTGNTHPVNTVWAWAQSATGSAVGYNPVGTFNFGTANTISYVNLTHPSSPTVFIQGDTWQATIKAAPNTPITVSGSNPGGSFSNVAEGTTDASGNLVLSKTTSTTSQLGLWNETWYAGSTPLSPNVSFTMVAPNTYTLSYVNITEPGSNGDYTQGDAWEVTIVGPPNAPVTVSGTNPGGPFTNVAEGTTDTHGNFTLSKATSTSTVVGQWTETWSVGGIPLTPNVSFTVWQVQTTISQPPVDPGDLSDDDYTGGQSMMPTSDHPIPVLSWTSSQPNNTSNVGVYPTDTFTATIHFGPPNAPVYVKVYSGTTGAAAFWFAPNCGTLQPCLIGTTDSTGFFTYSASWAGFAPDRYVEQWYVGNPGLPLLQIGTNPILFQIGQNFVGTNSYHVVAPGTPLPITASIGVPMADGLRKQISLASRVKVESASSSHVEENGKHRYDFDLDTREAQFIRIGDNAKWFDHSQPGSFENQNGWLSAGIGWASMPESERSPHSKFSVSSTWLPGPVAVMFQGSTTAPEVRTESVDNLAIARATSIRKDSTRKTVIGPAIPPTATEDQLRRIIRQWVSELNLAFLQPMTPAGASLSRTIGTLKPSTPLEREVVDCLRAVIQEENAQ